MFLLTRLLTRHLTRAYAVLTQHVFRVLHLTTFREPLNLFLNKGFMKHIIYTYTQIYIDVFDYLYHRADTRVYIHARAFTYAFSHALTNRPS